MAGRTVVAALVIGLTISACCSEPGSDPRRNGTSDLKAVTIEYSELGLTYGNEETVSIVPTGHPDTFAATAYSTVLAHNVPPTKHVAYPLPSSRVDKFLDQLSAPAWSRSKGIGRISRMLALKDSTVDRAYRKQGSESCFASTVRPGGLPVDGVTPTACNGRMSS
jgi:hypothetical protein